MHPAQCSRGILTRASSTATSARVLATPRCRTSWCVIHSYGDTAADPGTRDSEAAADPTYGDPKGGRFPPVKVGCLFIGLQVCAPQSSPQRAGDRRHQRFTSPCSTARCAGCQQPGQRRIDADAAQRLLPLLLVQRIHDGGLRDAIGRRTVRAAAVRTLWCVFRGSPR
jgi:hypothetical protein